MPSTGSTATPRPIGSRPIARFSSSWSRSESTSTASSSSAGLADYVLPPEVALVELPHYANLRRIASVARATTGTMRLFWRNLTAVDVVWLFGPHPFAAAFAFLALARRKRVVLGVRQNSVELYRKRVSGWKRFPALAAVHALDGTFRLLGRRAQVTVQGRELGERYGAPRGNVLELATRELRLSGPAAGTPRPSTC